MNSCSAVFVWTETRLYGAHVSVGGLEDLVALMGEDKANIKYITVVVRSDGDDEFSELEELIHDDLSSTVTIRKGKYDAKIAEENDPPEIHNANYWISATFSAKGRYTVVKKR